MGANASFPERSSSSSQPTSRSSSLSRHALHGVHGEGEGGSGLGRDKKKKASKLATLRKKFIRSRRQSRVFDHSKVVRELTSNWSIRELNALVEDYEASIALKDIAVCANLARTHANSFKEDLSNLYDYKFCTDVDLIYQGACFPVHRAILSIRCPFFRDLLAQYPDYGVQVPVDIRTPRIDVPMFSALLRYLYTGEFNSTDTKLENLDVLVQLGDEFGTPNPLEYDLRTLLENGDYSDAVIVFTSDADADALTPESGEGRSFKGGELYCHKAILAARSPFFRNLVLRRARSGEEFTERALQSPTYIVLDETVIPKQYARVLLHAIYLDTVDLSCIVRTSASMCSLSEVQAMVAGKGHMTHVDEAMEIYQIGQFLDFPTLSQGCEDIIADSLTLDNLVPILSWSREPHGSKWVHRQAIHFLKEEFLQIAHSPVLCELDKSFIIQMVKSDFLQAGELDVLIAVLKWGEHQLVRRMEDREPNLLSHTAHSVTKKGIKKRDMNDVELREILSEVLPYVRIDHVIPPHNDVLSNAIKRGLVSTPPSHMIGDDGAPNRTSAWVPGKNNGLFVKPRLFMPYYEEAKAMLDEQVSQVQENELVRLRMISMSSQIPDTLYMVEAAASRGGGGAPPGSSQQHRASSSSSSSSLTATVDIIAATIPVPDNETILAMGQREQELQRSKLVQRAYSLHFTDRRALAYHVQLRVVREFGLPDSAVELLQGYGGGGRPGSRAYVPEEHCLQPQAYQRTPQISKHSVAAMPLSPARSYSPIEQPMPKEPSICSDNIVSAMMPDIAMATSSLNQMALQDQDLELDLGDGNHSHSSTLNSHHGTMYV